MDTIVDQLRKHQKQLVQVALETFLTSSWSVDLIVPESMLRKVFSGIFSNLRKDLKYHQKYHIGENLSNYFVSTLKHQTQLRSNFDVQLAVLGIARSVLNHFLTNQPLESGNDFKSNFSTIQKTFDYCLIHLSRWWSEIYAELRLEDQQLIRQLKIVKDGLQQHLNLIYQILRESPVAIAGCDANFQIRYWNPMASKLTHYTPQDILNKNILSIFSDGFNTKMKTKLRTDKKHFFRMQVMIKRKDNSHFPALVSVSNINASQFPNFYYILSFIDITEQFQYKSSRQHFEQVMAISRLSSAIMHDIRNPIHALGLNIEIISDQLERMNLAHQDSLKAPLQRIQQELQILNQHLNQYLAYSQIIYRQYEPTELIARLREWAQEMSFELSQKKIRFNYQIPTTNIRIWGDWYQLRRVMVNLVQNAVEVLNDKGEIQLILKQKGDRVIIQIIDNGPGIPAEIKTKVFEPFFTTKHSGTGLGLFICKQIIKAHKGRITFVSRPGQGTRFSISLPINQTNGGRSEQA